MTQATLSNEAHTPGYPVPIRLELPKLSRRGKHSAPDIYTDLSALNHTIAGGGIDWWQYTLSVPADREHMYTLGHTAYGRTQAGKHIKRRMWPAHRIAEPFVYPAGILAC